MSIEYNSELEALESISPDYRFSGTILVGQGVFSDMSHILAHIHNARHYFKGFFLSVGNDHHIPHEITRIANNIEHMHREGFDDSYAFSHLKKYFPAWESRNLYASRWPVLEKARYEGWKFANAERQSHAWITDFRHLLWDALVSLAYYPDFANLYDEFPANEYPDLIVSLTKWYAEVKVALVLERYG